MAVSTRSVGDRLFLDGEKAAHGTIVYMGRDDSGWSLELGLARPAIKCIMHYLLQPLTGFHEPTPPGRPSRDRTRHDDCRAVRNPYPQPARRGGDQDRTAIRRYHPRIGTGGTSRHLPGLQSREE